MIGPGQASGSTFIVDLTQDDTPPVMSAPSAERIVSGDPRWTSWYAIRHEGNVAGRWESSPGAWTMNFDKWEFFIILSGSGEIVPSEGAPIRLEPGVTATIRPGFTGTWEVFETMTKYFFVRNG